MVSKIYITDIESAINYWRHTNPCDDGVTLRPELRDLATVYALLVYHRQDALPQEDMPESAYQAWLAWYATTADTPCIAICSTAQGDRICKGCGRDEEEVRLWPHYSPAQKRAVWHRISTEGTAWRFNRYAERVNPQAVQALAELPPSNHATTQTPAPHPAS